MSIYHDILILVHNNANKNARNKEIQKVFIKIAPLIAFSIAILWSYLLYPASVELMWKGRTFQLFFIWLIFVEIIFDWESIQTLEEVNIFSIKSPFYILTLIMPTVYVVISNYFGLNAIISNISKQISIQWWDSMALSIEYLAFTLLAGMITYFSFGKK